MGIERLHPERMEVFPAGSGWSWRHVNGSEESEASEPVGGQWAAAQAAHEARPELAMYILGSDPRTK